MSRKGRKARARARARGKKARLISDLHPGETLIMNYACDCAACSCASHNFIGVDCIPVGRSNGSRASAAAVDRCLLCSTAWKARRDTTDRLVLLAAGAEKSA